MDADHYDLLVEMPVFEKLLHPASIHHPARSSCWHQGPVNHVNELE